MSEDKTFLQRGYNTTRELEELGVFPPEEMVKSKRVAIIECVEDIPCNPCEHSCKLYGIIKESFTKPGKVDWELCVGCAACVVECPALAIFIQEISNGKGYVSLPYELLPDPVIGKKVQMLNRKGTILGDGKIVAPTYKVSGIAHPRWVVTVEMEDPMLSYEVRAIRIPK